MLSWPGVERLLKLYLSSLVLIPLGIWCVLNSAAQNPQRSQVAITLLVLGAGMLVFGAFGPRMEGPFKIGPSGAEGGLSPAQMKVVEKAGQRRLDDLVREGALPATKRPAAEKAVAEAAESLNRTRRAYVAQRRWMDRALLEVVGEAVADAAVDAIAEEDHAGASRSK